MPGKAPRLPSLPAAGADDGRGTSVADGVDAWREMVSALVPVIGERGVAALIERSIQVAARRFDWLAAASGGGGLVALERVFAARTDADAQAAHEVLLAAFIDVLEHLVGRELACRLLDPGVRAPGADDA